MDWVDIGFVLSLRRYGESATVVNLLTLEHGRHSGLVHGGNSQKKRGILQIGNEVHASWRARLEDHLGVFKIELVDGHAARVLSDPGRLAAMSSACALLDVCLPEREPHPNLFTSLQALLSVLPTAEWAAAYVAWELFLLEELGFGLDLTACAATGVIHDLIYVSPKSGRAVSRAAGEDYRDKLLPLPQFLIGRGDARGNAISDGLRLTAYFLERHVLGPYEKLLPDYRDRIARAF
ncbi:MAG: DNA repair protein RecO [Rickettsiales bacterium]|nr:DNA repair protein RecO [Rickettsiales bacterium]|tara:strand:- start:515 stop:1222 length:708 start_codon:yes stop_codon:yes gene_type:complete